MGYNLTNLFGLLYQWQPSFGPLLHYVRIVGIHMLFTLGLHAWQVNTFDPTHYTLSTGPQDALLVLYSMVNLCILALAIYNGIGFSLAGLALTLGLIVPAINQHGQNGIFLFTFPVILVSVGWIVNFIWWQLHYTHQKLLFVSRHDKLTGLFNRHTLEPEYLRMQALARQNNQPLMLVAWDIDRLKHINDTQGHAAGDEYILSFAIALRSGIRNENIMRIPDEAFRVGGDEFVSLHLGLTEGQALVERIRRVFGSVSAGWTLCGEGNLDQSLAKADDAMYFDKAARREVRQMVKEG